MDWDGLDEEEHWRALHDTFFVFFSFFWGWTNNSRPAFLGGILFFFLLVLSLSAR
jgi:hypothetical protein